MASTQQLIALSDKITVIADVLEDAVYQPLSSQKIGEIEAWLLQGQRILAGA